MLESLLSAFTHKQNDPVKSNMKSSNEFYQRELTIMIFLVTFEHIASQLENLAQFFKVSIHFHPCQ